MFKWPRKILRRLIYYYPVVNIVQKYLRRAFWYDGKILECGTPRNDLFFNDHIELRKEILDKLNIPNDRKVVLYAPTFRKDNNLDVYNVDYKKRIHVLRINLEESGYF